MPVSPAGRPRTRRGRPGAPHVPGEGLRERKKRLMRQLISDTATAMFLERGFDEVRVAEVAAACGVSEKTVYNYFPTKESLLLDREEGMAADIRRALGPGGGADVAGRRRRRADRPTRSTGSLDRLAAGAGRAASTSASSAGSST